MREVVFFFAFFFSGEGAGLGVKSRSVGHWSVKRIAVLSHSLNIAKLVFL